MKKFYLSASKDGILIDFETIVTLRDNISDDGGGISYAEANDLDQLIKDNVGEYCGFYMLQAVEAA